MGNVIINKASIEDFLQGQQFEYLLSAIDQEKEEPEKLKSSSEYFKVIGKNNENVIIENTQNKYLGHCRLKLLVDEGLPKKVCFLRNGMLITDNLHGLMRFYNFKDFVAVFECVNEEGNTLLREMEPPRHDDFEPELLSKEEQLTGKKALNSIKKWIKDMLKRHAQDPVEDETSLDELAQFIGTESAESDDNQNQEMNPVGQVRITAKRPKRKKISAPFVNEHGNGDGDEGSGGTIIDIEPNGDPGKKIEPGDGSNDGKEQGQGKEKHLPVKLLNVRISEIDNGKNNLFFTPTISGMIRLRALLSGADSDYPTSILSSEKGNIDNGALYIEVVANQRVKSSIEIEGSEGISLKVVADEV